MLLVTLLHTLLKEGEGIAGKTKGRQTDRQTDRLTVESYRHD
jgi:hypothetical protein